MKLQAIIFTAAITAVLGNGSLAQNPPRYAVTVIEVGGRQTKVYDINNAGQIVGEAGMADGTLRGFIYQNGSVTWLPFMGGGVSVSPRSINESGQVAGAATLADGKYHAFLYSGGVMTDLGTMGADRSYANGINEAGEVTGDLYQLGGTIYRPFIYTGGQMQILPALTTTYARSNDVNDQGLAAGQSVDSQGESKAFYSSASGPAVDIGTTGGMSEAHDINNSLEIVGFHTQGGERRGFFYRNGTVLDMGTLGGSFSVAMGINRWGQATGFSGISGGGGHAFLYSGGVMHDLNKWADAGPDLKFLNGGEAINDHGQIIGNMFPPEINLMYAWVATPNYRLTVTPRDAQVGETITVSWEVPAGRSATDWIGMYVPGADNSQYLWHIYTGGASSGSVMLTAPSPAGTYEFRYFLNNSFTDMGLSNPLNVSTPAGFSVSASATTVNAGQTITASWTAPSGRPAVDWIGLFRAGDPNRLYLAYAYTGGATSGSANFTAPSAPGSYEFRYLLNDGYHDVARSAPFNVNSSGYSVTPSATSVAPGGTLTVSWTAPAGSSSTDWIGLYREGETENRNYLWPFWFYTGGAESGSRSFTMPSTPGRYVFRYLLNNGYTHRAESVVVTVQ